MDKFYAPFKGFDWAVAYFFNVLRSRISKLSSDQFAIGMYPLRSSLLPEVEIKDDITASFFSVFPSVAKKDL